MHTNRPTARRGSCCDGPGSRASQRACTPAVGDSAGPPPAPTDPPQTGNLPPGQVKAGFLTSDPAATWAQLRRGERRGGGRRGAGRSGPWSLFQHAHQVVRARPAASHGGSRGGRLRGGIRHTLTPHLGGSGGKEDMRGREVKETDPLISAFPLVRHAPSENSQTGYLYTFPAVSPPAKHR